MLFVSSDRRVHTRHLLKLRFQSRNRDAFRFKKVVDVIHISEIMSFNLGIEMLFVSRSDCLYHHDIPSHVSISESRCFSFQVRFAVGTSEIGFPLFQSRNRDAFRFKDTDTDVIEYVDVIECFNLGIEMLFVSRK